MKLNKNNKGFTLVELVVVMAIFGIIMGAILNIIRPTNDVYNDVDDTMHTNVIGSGVAEYIDDELRYATNVLILENFPGVPTVSDAGKLGNYDVSFTNCLVFDNRNLRGTNLKNSPTTKDNVANRMGATGCVIKVSKVNEGGFNFNNSVVCKGTDFYDKFKFEFNQFDNTDKMIDNQIISQSTNMNNLEEVVGQTVPKYAFYLKVQAYSPKFENGGYVFEKSKFKKLTSIDLINVNIDASDKFKLHCDCDWGVMDFSHITDIYPASAPADATDGQKKYYVSSDENTYTYIFYKKESSASQTNCTVKWVRSNSDPVAPGAAYQSDTKVKTGATLKSFPTPPEITGYKKGYWLTEGGQKVDPAVGVVISDDTVFTLVYEPETPKALYTVTWNCYDGSSFITQVYEDSKPTAGNDTTVPEDKEFVRWAYDGDSSKGPSDITISGNCSFTSVVQDKHKVEFKPDGTNIDDTKTIYVSDGATAAWPDPANPPAAPDADHVFDKFVLEGTDLEMSTLAVTSDCVFVATFKEKSAEVNGWTISSVVNNSGYAKKGQQLDHAPWYIEVPYATNYTISVVPTTDQDNTWIKDFKLVVHLDKAGKVNNTGNFKYVAGNNTDTITLTPQFYNPIAKDSNITFVLTLEDETVGIQSVELSSAENINRSYF